MKKTSAPQIEMVSLDQLIPTNHIYRKFSKLLNFNQLTTELRKCENNLGVEGYGIIVLFKCLLLQFMEDLSDRELERFLQENTAAKFFCGFGLTDRAPKYSLFSKTRRRVGTDLLSKIFNRVKKSLQKQGYLNEVFNFVDASHLLSKNNLWKERDKAIAKKYEKLNNEVLPKVAVDKQAKIGCKGGNKYWYGYKKHTSVDMQSGLINKVAITPANVTDAKGLKHVCPSGGVVFGDKGYCTADAVQTIISKGCENATIKKNNVKGKDFDVDRWRTPIKSPYERVFSKTSHSVRYVGIVRNQFTAFMEALAHNLKRLVVMDLLLFN